MNPYELSQASSDAIQALIDSAHKLDPGSHAGGLLPKVLEQLRQRLLRLQQLHSRSWHLLRHNNEHAEFLMARLESLDVLCGRLLPGMSTARSIFNRLGKSSKMARGGRYELLLSPASVARCCLSFRGDDLVEILAAMSDELGKWLDDQEAILERLSCQAYGVFPRLQSETLESYQRVPKVMRRIGEALIFGEERCVVVHGPAGVGKSTLAAFVATNPPECFSDGAAEVRLGRPYRGDDEEEEEQLAVRLRHLLQDLNCHRDSSMQKRVASVEDCWSLLQEVLLESSHLIVLDDVCDKNVIERLLRLKNHSCKFLVTCQDDPTSHLSSDIEHLVCSIKLGFKETAAVSAEILRLHTGMKELPVAAGKLLRYCSHHPLSISILGEALRGSWRKQEWRAVVSHFEVSSSSGIPPEKRKKLSLKRTTSVSGSIRPLNWMAGVVASIELGRVGMQQETQQLFDSLSTIPWSEPVPVECLKALWVAVGNSKSPFLIHARELVRRCLIKRRPDFIFYELHELVGVYLERKLPAALDQLLHLSLPGTRAMIAPWLLQFGNDSARQAASEALRGVLILENEELHAKALISIVEVLKASSSSSSPRSSSSREEVCRIVGAEIVNLLFRASSAWVYAAITRFISACFSQVDYEEYGRGLVASGLVEKLRSLLSGSSGVSPLVKKDVADVLARVASSCRGDRYVVESLIRANLMPELVNLVDSRSGWIHEGAIHAVVKLVELGEEAVDQLLESEMLEKLLQLLQSRKQSSKARAMETIGSLVRSGGGRVVERLLSAGVAGEIEAQLQRCPYEDVRAGCCSLCREMFLAASGESLERLVRCDIVESLTALLGDSDAEMMRSQAVAALQELVRLRGKPVVDRIVRAAGVGSFVKGLETLPNDAAFTLAYKKLLHSIID